MKEYPQCPSCGGICPQIPPKKFCKRDNVQAIKNTLAEKRIDMIFLQEDLDAANARIERYRKALAKLLPRFKSGKGRCWYLKTPARVLKGRSRLEAIEAMEE